MNVVVDATIIVLCFGNVKDKRLMSISVFVASVNLFCFYCY